MLFIRLNRKDSRTLSKQIYQFIKESILNGEMKENERLPASRELSKNLNVSRNIVIESYEQLIAEGYLYTKNGSGTYVSEGVTFKVQSLHDYEEEKKQADMKSVTKEQAEDDVISFRTGIPDLESIPIKKWGNIYKKITLSACPGNMDYQNSNGHYKLRYELANYLRRVRGVKTKADNIIITNGAAQVFSLLCQIINNNEYALVENPLSYGLLNTLRDKNINIKPIPVDEYGMITGRLQEMYSEHNITKKYNRAPKLIFTTPSHQFPTGVILPIKRRIELIQYARKYDAFIVEDDYDSEFRFSGSPIESMQTLDPERVIYVGTFSKTFMPALRMGYMILPECIHEKIEKAKYIDDIHSPIFEQLTMTEFIREGLLDLHIKKMNSIYFKRRNKLIECLKDDFGDEVSISGEEAGMHLMASFKGICFDKRLMEKIQNEKVEVTPVRKHYICDGNNDRGYDNSLIFGYGNTKVQEIEEGVRRLRRALI